MTFINEIKILKERLISSTTKSIFSNAHPKKSIDKIDFVELFSLNLNPNITPNEIIKLLFFEILAFVTVIFIFYDIMYLEIPDSMLFI